MPDAARISVLLPTFNNESLIRDCLESVKWADEILVVDSFSTDRTLEICREYGARIVPHEYVNSAKQKNWAIPQCAHEWILQIDTDELLEEGARAEIEQALSCASPQTHAFTFARKNYVLNKWLQVGGLYPDHQTRLFRRNVGRFEEKEVHAHVVVPGEVATLKHHIVHFGMTSISKQLCNLDRYSRYQAQEWYSGGHRFNYRSMFIRPIGAFIIAFFLQGGFRAGWRGYLICAHRSIYSCLTYCKLWELEWQNGERH